MSADAQLPWRSGLLPDTHAHLDAPVFADDLGEVLTRANDAGVEPVLAVGSDLASSRRVIEIAHRHASVYAAVGMHPHEAGHFRQDAGELEALLDDERVVAVGEIGLDYYRDRADRAVQIEAFRAQLHWASSRAMVVSVHNRAADDDVLAMLGECDVTAILHCFSGAWPTAARAVEAGHYLSFAGNLTYPKAGPLREVAARVPMDRVLLETDSPVLAPQPKRGRRNEPAYLAHTLTTFAAVREMTVNQAASCVSANAERLFRWEAR